VPGGIWTYKAPENLVPGAPAADLKPTLAWALKASGNTAASVRRAFALPASAGPRQAIAIRLDNALKAGLGPYVPPPYLAETVEEPGGKARAEQVSALVFLEFVYRGNVHLFVMKRRDADGTLVPGRRGSFVLVPGAIQEHTVVLDPTRRAVREPLTGE